MRQLKLLTRAREFLELQDSRGVDVAVHPECYLNGWARVPGHARLRALAGERGAGVFAARAKDALHLARRASYEVVGAIPANGRQLVVSWCRRSDFAESGEYRDRYFGTSSRESPETVWFLIGGDDVGDVRTDSNVLLFRPRSGAPRVSLAPFLHALARPANPADGSRPSLSATVSFADAAVAAIVSLIAQAPFQSLVLPYEAQPFQQALCREVKRRRPGLLTLGYLHSALPPLPTDLIWRKGAPERLLVHGPGQAEILSRHLGWSESALRVIPSLRYRVGDGGNLAGQIFLPYSFGDAAIVEGAFRQLLAAAEAGSLPPLTVRNHPVMATSKSHLELQARLEAAMREQAGRFAPAAAGIAPVSVFIGATAAILEALEHGIAVVHICAEPLTEAHSSAIWSQLETERLGEHVFRYRQRVPGAYIRFGERGALFDQYIARQTERH